MDADLDNNSIVQIENVLMTIYNYLLPELINELQAQGHTVTNVLKNSIEGTVSKFTDILRLDGSFVFYGKFVDTGRRAGARRVPIDALIQWIKDKNFQADVNKTKGAKFNIDNWRRGLAFAIQKTIFDKGISTPESWAGESTAKWMTNVLDRNQNKIGEDIYNAIDMALEIILFNIVRDINSRQTTQNVN